MFVGQLYTKDGLGVRIYNVWKCDFMYLKESLYTDRGSENARGLLKVRLLRTEEL
jgi:hypothetical protein